MYKWAVSLFLMLCGCKQSDAHFCNICSYTTAYQLHCFWLYTIYCSRQSCLKPMTTISEVQNWSKQCRNSWDPQGSCMVVVEIQFQTLANILAWRWSKSHELLGWEHSFLFDATKVTGIKHLWIVNYHTWELDCSEIELLHEGRYWSRLCVLIFTPTVGNCKRVKLHCRYGLYQARIDNINNGGSGTPWLCECKLIWEPWFVAFF